MRDFQNHFDVDPFDAEVGASSDAWKTRRMSAGGVRSQPSDQADGLRRLFAASKARFIAVASNPHVGFAGVVLERMTSVFSALGIHALVVDAAENAPAPNELAVLDLAVCIEPLSAEVSYLAAQGLPMRHVDARGSCAGFLQAVSMAAPRADVVLVHAPAAELSRLFSRRATRPVLLAADHPASVTHAYAAMKLLSIRNGLMSYDMVLAADPESPRHDRIAAQLASCADHFLGAVLHDVASVDPACDVHDDPGGELTRLMQALLSIDDEAGAEPLPMRIAATPFPTRPGTAMTRN